jgi:hypothetical protein
VSASTLRARFPPTAGYGEMLRQSCCKLSMSACAQTDSLTAHWAKKISHCTNESSTQLRREGGVDTNEYMLLEYMQDKINTDNLMWRERVHATVLGSTAPSH